MNSPYFIELSIYMIFAAGALLFMWSDVELLIGRYRLRHRLRAVRSADKKLPGPLRYIYGLIDVSFESEAGKRFFLIFEGVLFIASYILSYRNYSFAAALPVSALSVSMPVLVLASRLEAGRAEASLEGMSLVSELHRQYRINGFNIYEAIEKTALYEGGHRLSSKRLCSLLMRLRSACGAVELREAVDRFVFSYGSFWAKMLGQCIRLSIERGCDISAALSDLARQLREANKLDEKRKALNAEASRMTLLLIPLMYLGCMAVSVFYLGIKASALLRNQFLDPTGFLLFLVCAFLFLINILLIYMISNSRLD